MKTANQNFNAKNFGVIYNLLNRKGKVDITKMSCEFQEIVRQIKECRNELRALRQKKRSSWSEDEKELFETKNDELDSLLDARSEELDKNISSIADEVNNSKFRFSMMMHKHREHEEFTIDTTRLAPYFAICQLQHNLKMVFNVNMPSRHQIMCQLKILLNTITNGYIIRADVEDFFESIPQAQLLQKLENNSLLSYKSFAFIKSILKMYEECKTKDDSNEGKGVPRGVGISSMLSEIYMQDIDRKIRSRDEVVYYVRYVDDIFIILTSLGSEKSIEDYYKSLCGLFNTYGLSLHDTTHEKTKLIRVSNESDGKIGGFDYLGYGLSLNVNKGKPLKTEFGLSLKRKDKYRKKIEKAFLHFENLCKVNIRQARRDLLDSLDFITGNCRLANTKGGVKVGVFYSNDLLTKYGIKNLEGLTNMLQSYRFTVYENAFVSSHEKDAFVMKLKERISKFSFENSWENKRVCSLSIDRIAEITGWLYEKEEDKAEV